MTYKEFAAAATKAQVRYHNNYVTRLIAERGRQGQTERMILACPACQSTSVTRLNFSRANLYGEPLRDQCDRCRHQFLEDEALLLPWPS